MKNVMQKLLLMVFVLLQCIAPLAHAHVDGLDAEANLYSHDTQHNDAHTAHIENHLGAVVSVVQATPMNFALDVGEPELLGADSVQASATAVSLFSVHRAIHFLLPSSTRYALAWSQAPPL